MKITFLIFFASAIAFAKEGIKSNPCAALMSVNMRLTQASVTSESPFVLKKNKLVPRESLKVVTKEKDKTKEVYTYTDSNNLSRRIEISGQGNQFSLKETFDPVAFEKILETSSNGRIRPRREKQQGDMVTYRVKDGVCFIEQMGVEFNDGEKSYSLIGYDASFCEKLSKKINLNYGDDEVLARCSQVFEDLNYIYKSREVELEREKKTFGKKTPGLDSIYNLAEAALRCKPDVWEYGLGQFIENFSQGRESGSENQDESDLRQKVKLPAKKVKAPNRANI